jgi:Na+-driven multidrug efflux pump
MDAAGVAIATKISTVLSAVLILRALCKSDGIVHLNFRKLCFHWETLKEILWIGVPAGFQGALYTISNVFIQSSVNSLGSAAMAGNAASQSLEGLINVTSASYYQTAMSFTGQNLGGGKYKRVIKSTLICLLYTTTILMVCGTVFLIFGRQLLGLYNPETDVVNWGMQRMVIMMSSYFLCGISDTITGALRGLGYSVLPTVTTIMGTCVLRIFWVFAIFPQYRTLYSLIFSYPVSWALIALCNGLTLFFICRGFLHRAGQKRDKSFILKH